jgi:hypothetical protein
MSVMMMVMIAVMLMMIQWTIDEWGAVENEVRLASTVSRIKR